MLSMGKTRERVRKGCLGACFRSVSAFLHKDAEEQHKAKELNVKQRRIYKLQLQH